MDDTGFTVPEEKLDRLADCYQADPETGNLEVFETNHSLYSCPAKLP
jgi:hypothetical protein